MDLVAETSECHQTPALQNKLNVKPHNLLYLCTSSVYDLSNFDLASRVAIYVMLHSDIPASTIFPLQVYIFHRRLLPKKSKRVDEMPNEFHLYCHATETQLQEYLSVRYEIFLESSTEEWPIKIAAKSVGLQTIDETDPGNWIP